MRRLTTAMLFALAVLLVAPAAGWSAESAYQKGLTAALSGDFATALAEWRPLAEQGHVRAQLNLGLMYSNADGVERDDAAAAKWWRMAAAQGDTGAQFYLGKAYAKGRGVAQDNVAAYMWLSIAAAQRYKFAVTNRDTVGGRMSRADIAEAQKLAKFCVARSYQGC